MLYKPLSSVIKKHNICHHVYVTQIYISLSKTDTRMSLSLTQQCLQNVFDYMIASRLQLITHNISLYYSVLNPGMGVENYSKTDSKIEKNIAY